MDSEGEFKVQTSSHDLPHPTSGNSEIRKLFSTLGKQRPNDASTFATDHFTHTDSSAEELAGKDVTGEVGSRDDVNSLDQYYVPIDTYEGRHRYDPKAAWTLEEEKALIRRLDIRVCAYCCLMFFCLQLDRGNISQALSDNMLKDLGLNTNDYNTGQTIFYVSFLAAELPSQLVSKKLGPVRLPRLMPIACYFLKVATDNGGLDRTTGFQFRWCRGVSWQPVKRD